MRLRLLSLGVGGAWPGWGGGEQGKHASALLLPVLTKDFYPEFKEAVWAQRLAVAVRAVPHLSLRWYGALEGTPTSPKGLRPRCVGRGSEQLVDRSQDSFLASSWGLKLAPTPQGRLLRLDIVPESLKQPITSSPLVKTKFTCGRNVAKPSPSAQDPPKREATVICTDCHGEVRAGTPAAWMWGGSA